MSDRSKFWLLSFITLLAVGLTLSLGRWQLSRAAEKERLQASVEARGQQDELPGAVLLQAGPADLLIHRRIRVRGRWLGAHTVFLDNRPMNARPGFYVVTPLQLEGSGQAVLVQRGWVARNFTDRARLPTVDTPPGEVRLSGRIAPPPAKLYELGQAQAGPIRQNLDLAQFSVQTGVPLLPVSIVQAGEPSEGLLREWPLAGAGIDRHYGYAFQWFGLSALLAILYVWFQIVRPIFKRPRI